MIWCQKDEEGQRMGTRQRLEGQLEPGDVAQLVAIGQRVKTARTARRLTHGRLAAQVGMTRNTMMQIEAGNSSFCVTRLLRLAVALEVDVCWLLTGNGEQGVEDGRNAHAAGSDSGTTQLWGEIRASLEHLLDLVDQVQERHEL